MNKQMEEHWEFTIINEEEWTFNTDYVYIYIYSKGIMLRESSLKSFYVVWFCLYGILKKTN